ncbi:hypothetical protein Pedsa_1187 [Pseudopedobacter saltans DSM 12145]|uniref:Uncharacterized protein n=1 Tax=Pseudopedobacter saltans (strain ATCC 51119 / DSM 12145 / JCM 21818 / CCUG 39354 / LMG 10337 / NBRC 100064 / NCIMB 13643) TaxID=762903 RepID=F0SCZ8_PSESL|nr:DUF6266 family protein [Pseudopedobacter saltans]ADY51755.1 hypothetical protein Pedsa_1187 [Pseudopedobacter saltans DSM 12145]
MGRLLKDINGAFSGKVGSVIGFTRNGKAFIKGPYKRRTKKVSEKELFNREKFSLAQAWLKPLLLFVREGFKGYSDTAQGFIAAKSYLMKHAMTVEDGKHKIDPEKMKVSSGSLPLSENIVAERIQDNEIKFSWDRNQVKGTSSYDQVMLLAYHVESENCFAVITGPFRYIGEAVLEVYERFEGYHVYLAFCAVDRSSQSDSVYLGKL